jgi:hypothetical protein
MLACGSFVLITWNAVRIPIFPILRNLASSVVSSVGSQLFAAQESFLNSSNGKLNESSEEKGLFLRVSIKSNQRFR